eukprot:6193208-Pleurochrysis_carterae.AAC.2
MERAAADPSSPYQIARERVPRMPDTRARGRLLRRSDRVRGARAVPSQRSDGTARAPRCQPRRRRHDQLAGAAAHARASDGAIALANGGWRVALTLRQCALITLVVDAHGCLSPSHTRKRTRLHVCVHVRARVQARTHTRTHARTYARTHAHTHAHTYARTHTRTYALPTRACSAREGLRFAPMCDAMGRCAGLARLALWVRRVSMRHSGAPRQTCLISAYHVRHVGCPNPPAHDSKARHFIGIA